MANRIKVATQPCPDGKHEFNDYAGGGHCSTAYCDWWSEEHCIKCGWFISHCSCGDNDGESKISTRQWAAIIDKWMEQKRKGRGQ